MFFRIYQDLFLYLGLLLEKHPPFITFLDALTDLTSFFAFGTQAHSAIARMVSNFDVGCFFNNKKDLILGNLRFLPYPPNE